MDHLTPCRASVEDMPPEVRREYEAWSRSFDDGHFADEPPGEHATLPEDAPAYTEQGRRMGLIPMSVARGLARDGRGW